MHARTAVALCMLTAVVTYLLATSPSGVDTSGTHMTNVMRVVAEGNRRNDAKLDQLHQGVMQAVEKAVTTHTKHDAAMGRDGDVAKALEKIQSSLKSHSEKLEALAEKLASTPAPKPPSPDHGGVSGGGGGGGYEQYSKEELDSFLAAMNDNVWAPDHCDDLSVWYHPYLSAIPYHEHDMTIVNVGVNKAYIAGELLSPILGNASHSPQQLYKSAIAASRKYGKGISLCGLCCDCLEEQSAVVSERQWTDVRFFAYDLMRTSIELFNTSFPSFGRLRSLGRQLGVGPENMWSENCAEAKGIGYEFCSVVKAKEPNPARKHFPLPVRNLDTLYKEDIKWGPVHLLFIDANGYDITILKGATGLLKKKLIKVVVFELWEGFYDRKPTDTWYVNHTKLFKETFEGYGYRCFYQIKTGMVKRSHRQQFPRFMPLNFGGLPGHDWMGWGNAICIDDADPYLRKVFQFLSSKQAIPLISMKDPSLYSVRRCGKVNEARNFTTPEQH